MLKMNLIQGLIRAVVYNFLLCYKKIKLTKIKNN